MIIERPDYKSHSSNLSSLFSNYMLSTILCDPPKDRHLFEGQERVIEMEIANTAFYTTVRVVFGQYPWNIRRLIPVSSTGVLPTSSHSIVSSISSSHSDKPHPPVSSNGSSHTTKKNTEKNDISLPLGLLVKVGAGLAFLLALLIYCYRRSKL